MSRVMFVDDEPLILRTIERLFRTEREWQTSTCPGGAEALARLDEQPVDVIVSDLNMPEMDGLTLLEHVRERHPGIARFILSGYSAQADVVRTASVVHQFLAKPCDTETLRNRIRRVLSVRAAVSVDVRVHTAWMSNLPPMPKIFGAITMALESPKTTARSIAALVEQDVALSTKILQLVNGAYYGLRHRVTSVEQAVMVLGTKALRALVLSQEMFQAFPAPKQKERIARLQEHSLRASALVRRFTEDRAEAETASTAALLHDVGELVLLSLAGDPGHDSETTSEHVIVGSSLLALWGLPDEILNPVAHHHQPRNAPAADRRVTALVHVAEGLERGADKTDEELFDLAFLQEIGMADKLQEWRQIASAEAKSQSAGSDDSAPARAGRVTPTGGMSGRGVARRKTE